MFASKLYGIFALGLAFAGAAPAQAGWNGWQWMSIMEKAHQHRNVAPQSHHDAFANAGERVLRRRAPSARESVSRRPHIVGHTGHIGGY